MSNSLEREEEKGPAATTTTDQDNGSSHSGGTHGNSNDDGSNHHEADNDNYDDDGDNVLESAGDGTTAADQVLHGIPLLLCALALLLCVFLVALDQTIVATILEEVGSKFGDFGKVSWVSSGFLLPTAVLAMNWGKISLVFGRKYTMIVAIVLFEIGSLVCALANSMNMLIGGRVLAGVGGGGIQVMVFIIVTEIVTIDKRGMLQGLVGAAFGIASVVGPLVGGAFTSNVTWRWCFYINLPIGGFAVLCIWYLFNPPPPKGSLKEKLLAIDYLGTFLLAAGLIFVLLALTFGSTDKPWNSAMVIAFFVVGGVMLIAFGVWNFGFSKIPLVPARVAKIPQVIAVCISFFLVFNAFMSAVLYLSTYFQVAKNADAMHSGLFLLPMIISLVIFSILMGIVVSKTRLTKPYAFFGTAVASIGFGVMSMLEADTGPAKRIGYLILPGIGIGCLFQSMALSIQVAAPKDQGGVLVATAMIGFFRSLGGTVGSALGQTIQSVIFSGKVSKLNLPSDVDPLALLNSPELIRKLPKELADKILDAFVDGFHAVIYYGAASAAVAFFIVFFFTNKKIPKSNDGKKDEKAKETSDDTDAVADQV